MTIYTPFVLWYNLYRKERKEKQNEKLYRNTFYQDSQPLYQG